MVQVLPRVRRVKELLALVCVVQFGIIAYMLMSSAGSTSHAAPNRMLPMLEVGKVLAMQEDQRKEIAASVQSSRQTSMILMQSCMKSRDRDRLLLEELLRDNQNLREGKVHPPLRAFNATRRKKR